MLGRLSALCSSENARADKSVATRANPNRHTVNVIVESFLNTYSNIYGTRKSITASGIVA